MRFQKLPSPRIVLLAGLLSIAFATFAWSYPERLIDFRAFYCSGRALLLQADPYRQLPLTECEHALRSTVASPLPASMTIPAPFPGYTLGLFALVALIPFPIAVIIWLLALVAAIVTTCVLCSRMLDLPCSVAALTIAFPAVIAAVPLGQLTPFIILSIVSSAWFLARHRLHLAVLALVGTNLDPHIGPVITIAMFIGQPRARGMLIASAITLGAASIALTGPHLTREYLVDVLPLHAYVNVPESTQFSISNLAFVLGASRDMALHLGSLCYVIVVVTGIVVALRLRRRLGERSLVLVPAAFCVFGGTYAHLQQLAFAIPAFLALCSTLEGRQRTIAVAATYVAAIPWLVLIPFPMLYIPAVGFALTFARLMRVGIGRRMAFVIGFGLVVGLVALVSSLHPDRIIAPFQATGNPLVDIGWGQYVDATSLPGQTWWLFAKLPTYLAFSVNLALLTFASFSVLVHPAKAPEAANPAY